MKSLLNRSLNEKSVLDMIYMKNDGTVSKRAIIVHQLKQQYVRAFCFSSRQTKTFRIGNIRCSSFLL
ncbi:WYL domain-containing protein [Bacillus nakamurai]|uniref:WYL domain-containing protein n=1 Tax=Bacillus nakamurai TaxID=1793963 RepID=UPI0020C334ED|nr:WYL domain-containing protein [Bacillus nakamurai]MCP6684190.1 WYL domain-containing protein [Bacillus nakamurai]